jgi:hypothetical protein
MPLLGIAGMPFVALKYGNRSLWHYLPVVIIYPVLAGVIDLIILFYAFPHYGC